MNDALWWSPTSSVVVTFLAHYQQIMDQLILANNGLQSNICVEIFICIFLGVSKLSTNGQKLKSPSSLSFSLGARLQLRALTQSLTLNLLPGGDFSSGEKQAHYVCLD